jgi:predicted metal-binding membrane protein
MGDPKKIMGSHGQICNALFRVDFFIEGTIFTRILFVDKRTLDFPMAKGSGNNPAGSSSGVPLVETIVDGVSCSRAKAQFINLVAARVPAAFHIFPAIGFFLHFQNFFAIGMLLPTANPITEVILAVCYPEQAA